MHSRNFCTHNNAQNNNNNNMNTKTILNPLSADSNSNYNNHYSGMTHNDNGLRAASHVSMEHTIDAHEYQPTCKCADCQTLLKHYTQYNILDAYVTHHLAYESSLQANFGFVPAIGGPFGHVAMRTIITDILDERTGEVVGQEEQQQPVPSQSYLFHMHLHHMNPVPAEFKERSLSRFYAPKEATTASAVTTSSNNNTMSIPAPNSKRYNNNNNNRNNNTMKYNNNTNYHSQNYNNYYGNWNRPAPVPAYNDNSAHQQSFNQVNYTAADVEQATQASNFTGGAARLGN